jgi:hypothetical protein
VLGHFAEEWRTGMDEKGHWIVNGLAAERARTEMDLRSSA